MSTNDDRHLAGGAHSTRRPSWKALTREARARFGVEELRPGQRDIIEALLEGKDVLGVMPTGAGKSLCFQLPALFLPRATVVVSPLLALMQDQHEKLSDAAVDVVKLDSTLTQREADAVTREVRRGEHEIIEVPGTGIVYTATVKKADEVWNWLKDAGIEAARYHGQLKASEREEVQQRFMANEYRVIVATKAFGLGIDKPDIRFVAHWQFPDSLETYYQEAGRAGRDGAPARGVLLYRLEDRRIQGYFLGGKYPRREESQALYSVLRELWAHREGKPVSLKVLTEASGLPANRVKVLVAQLSGAGILERGPRGLKQLRDFDSAEELAEYLTAYEKRHQSDRERLQRMMRYGQTTECRWHFIGEYFGEPEHGSCRHCDNCAERAAGHFDATSATALATPPAPGAAPGGAV